MASWTTSDAESIYNVHGWGRGFFGVNPSGHVEVYPDGDERSPIDLQTLAKDVRRRGIELPLLVRFNDVVGSRIRKMVEGFQTAIDTYVRDAIDRCFPSR